MITNKIIRDINNLLSKERLKYYNDSIEEHDRNLNLIAQITPNMAMIEISIRNIVDFYIKQEIRSDWIVNPINEDIRNEKENIDSRFKSSQLTHEQYLSNFSFGKIVHLALSEEYNLGKEIFTNLNLLDFTKYSKSNKNSYIYDNKKNNFDDIQKTEIILKLLLTIRNRCYHWENLLKTRTGNHNRKYPRITTNFKDTPKIETKINKDNFKSTYIGIDPSKIDAFLYDILNIFLLGVKNNFSRAQQ